MWILILTLSYYHGAGAIDHIEFPTRESCTKAAAFWQEHVTVWVYDVKSAVCVESPK